MQTTILIAVLGACLLAFTTADMSLSDPHDVALNNPQVVLEGIATIRNTLYVLRTNKIDTYKIDRKTDLPTYDTSTPLDAGFGTPSDMAIDNVEGVITLYVIAKKTDTSSCLYKIPADNLKKQECITLSFADPYGLKLHISYQLLKGKNHILIVCRSCGNVVVYEEDGTTLIQTIDLSALVHYPKNPKHGRIYSVLDIVEIDGKHVVSYGRNNGNEKNEDFPAAGLCSLTLDKKPGDNKDYTGSCDKTAPINPSINYPLNLQYDWFTGDIVIGDRGIDGQTGDKGATILTIETDLKTPKVVTRVSGFFVNRFCFTYLHMFIGGSKTVRKVVKVGKKQQIVESTEAVLKYYTVNAQQ